MPFGISSGPEVFHREMCHLLSGIPGVACDIDDVLISGTTQQEHDDRLHTVLDRMQDAGVTLNEKCIFSTDSIKFLGHIVSSKVDPAKVDAITKFPRPNDVPQLRRLLGMVNYVGKFVLNLADVTKPLRDLLKKESEWTWGAPQEEAFQRIKQQLVSAPVLAHYSPNRPTCISCDSSSFGLDAVLLQKQKDGEMKPVFYQSRSPTPTEQRYAQVEKKALAVTWACHRHLIKMAK